MKYVIPVRIAIIKKISVGKDGEKREFFYTVFGNMHCCSHWEKTIWSFLIKLIGELSQDPTISLLDIYSKEMKSVSGSGICTPLFIGALFIAVKMEKQSNSVDKWLDEKTWYTHTDSISLKTRIKFCHNVTRWMNLC